MSIVAWQMAACGASVAPGVIVELANHGSPAPVAALYVEAVDVQSPGATSWEVHDRTRDLLVEASWQHGLLPIGPWDVARLSGAPDGAPLYEVSTLGAAVDAARVPRDRVLVLQSAVTLHIATVAGGRGDRTTVHGTDGEVEAHLSLRDASTGRLIATADVGLTVDPLDSIANADPAPWTTRALVEALRKVLQAAERDGALSLPSPPVPVAGLRLIGDPRAADDFRVGSSPSFAQHAATLNALDAELARLARAERLEPGDPAGLVQALEGRPRGLYVLESPPDSPLQTGDVILEAEGRPTLRLPDWARAILLAPPEKPLSLLVDRGGALVRVSVALGTRSGQSAH